MLAAHLHRLQQLDNVLQAFSNKVVEGVDVRPHELLERSRGVSHIKSEYLCDNNPTFVRCSKILIGAQSIWP